MNKTWHEFLSSQGAVEDENKQISFNDPNTDIINLDDTYLCDLSHLGLIKACGEDTQNFLHSQFTNDLKQVSNTTSQLSSYCNPKGRILSIFRIFKRDDDFFLLMRKDVIEATLQKLTMFKLMAKVELTDVSDNYVIYGVAGPESDSVLTANKINFPENTDQSLQDNKSSIIRVASESSRLLFICETEQAISTWKALSEKTIQTNAKVWQLHDIQSGIPQVTAETSEAFIPQMVNLELIDGVNFQKGCYPGQEIVARTHYLGKPNRRMFKINIKSDQTPNPGDNIFSEKDGDQPVGKIVTAVKSNRDAITALAVLRIEKKESQDLHICSIDGPEASVLSLPYSLETEAI